jgi:creatinine amidohydrolase/Fe(II)-dependent formamide hydrolase-like protein
MADHAGFYETALVMAAKHNLVDLDRLTVEPVPWYCATETSPAREATVEAGERMWQAMVEAWVERLPKWLRRDSLKPSEVTLQGLF